MKSKVLWALIALNVLLLVAFFVPHGLTSSVQAQAANRPSDYLMIPGEIIGGNNAVVYVVDMPNQQLSTMNLRTGGTALEMSSPPLDLKHIFAAGGR